ELGWRIAIGGLGWWSRVPTVTYHWEYAPSLDLHRGLPVGPLPPGSLRRIERTLRRRASATSSGIPAPDAVALAIFASIQAARPGPLREMWLGDVAAHLEACDADEAMRLADELGVAPALRWAGSAEASQLPSGREGPLFDRAPRRAAWSILADVRRSIRP